MSVARGAATMLCLLGLHACAPYKLQTLAEQDTSATGVSISVRTAQRDFFLELLNHSTQILIVIPSVIELFFNGNHLRPEAASPPSAAPPGGRLSVKLTFDADLDEPDPERVHTLLLDKGLRLSTEPAGLDTVRLVARRRARWEPERVHFSILSGFAFHYFYGTPFHSAFAEFRLGGRRGPLEITGRVRFHLGKTQSDLPFFHATGALGVLGTVHPRVRVGAELGFFPSMLIIGGPVAGGLGAATFDVHAELVADLVQRPAGAMLLSARIGMTGDLFGASHPYLFGPSMLIGLGYRFP